jgi:ribonuclease VapC
MIVDTSALIAILRREEDSDALAERLLGADEVRMSSGTLLEARIVAEREGGEAELAELLDLAGIEIVPPDARQIDLAFEGFRRFGRGRHPAALNFGDLFAYALARALDEPLLFKGEDFGKTDVTPV